MTNEEVKKLTVSLTAVSVVLIALLLGVIVYQIVTIAIYKARIREYEALKLEYERIIEQAQDDLEYYRSEYYLEQIARAYGYIYPEDKN